MTRRIVLLAALVATVGAGVVVVQTIRERTKITTSEKPANASAENAAIITIDPMTYELPRALRDEVMANLPRFAIGARLVPAMKDGRLHGFKLVAMQPDSMFAVLGFQDGDIIKAINDISLVETNQSFRSLHTASLLRVAIERTGNSAILTWRIK